MRNGNLRACGIEKFAVLDVAGYIFYKNRRGTFFKFRGKRGMFFLLGGVLAGYWRGISIVEDLTCQYMKSGKSACMFRISYSLQFRQYRRYIAVNLKEGNSLWSSLKANSIGANVNQGGGACKS